MKKVLLSSAALCGLAMVATPAYANIQLDIGGWMKGYGVFVDQDDRSTTSDERSFDFLRNTEIHFTGEVTLDNGLIVGFHSETEADGEDSLAVEESYAYFSGGWGRVNFGAEDGAQFLLQVEAPSADGNVDGLRQYIQPVNYTVAIGAAGPLATAVNANGLDYEANASGYSDKLTYLSPILNGFQLGVSYTPDVTDNGGNANDLDGVRFDDQADEFGEVYEAGVRYEGQFNNVGVTVGAGYAHVEVETTTAGFAAGSPSDDRHVWNVGIDLDIGPFGIGASYSEDDYGETEIAGGGTRDDEETLVVGIDYTTGPFKLGASYMNQDGTLNVLGNTGNGGVETDRYTGGVVYTYGPGMTFRGSLSYVEHDNVAGLPAGAGDEIEATSFLLGTQIKF